MTNYTRYILTVTLVYGSTGRLTRVYLGKETSVMLTPPSTTNGQKDENEQAIMSQIDELRQLFLDHERIVDDKSSNLESISEGLNEVQEKNDLNGTLEEIRMHLNGLLRTFQGKLATTYSEQREVEERENSLQDTFESLTAIENQHRTETPHEAVSQLQGYLHTNGHNLGILSHCFNDVLDSANGLMSSIPMNKTNTTHMNELISLIEGCIGSFCT